jgi:hypothetical protein
MALKSNFRLLTHSPERINVQSGKLGAAKSERFTDADIGKPVKKGTQGNFVICTAADAIEGFIDSIDAGGTTDGFSFGGVATGNRGFRTKVTVAKAGTDIAVLNYVVAGTNGAAGIANSGGLGVVTQSNSGVGNTETKWRIVSLEGDVASTTADSIVAVIELQ